MSLRFDPDALARVRTERGLNQAELSRRIGRNRFAVNAWENRRKEPTLDTIGRLADALGVEYTELITRAADREAVAS
ncbi:hypothetical protein SUDANB106_04111 [Streptomyces sp. enrichment culture]|uniref:helix-turn-helix transcriptional regulator n=1 Tax=Streptomyces sp. enrichment culture TaxID=1795815 RepID=UPI003F54E5C2